MELHKILVVDDEESVRSMVAVLLQKEKYQVSSAPGGKEALDLLGEQSFDLVISDIRMPRMDGLQLLDRIQALYPDITVIMMSAFGTVDLAVEAMKRGAYDYITKPFKPDEILLALRKAHEREALTSENTRLKEEVGERFSLEGIVARSPSMVKIMESVRKVAGYRSHVLITGESGTGKEVLARAVHNLSPWKDIPLSPSTAARSPPPSWRASSSVMSRELSPTPLWTSPASSRKPAEVPCF